MAQYMAGMSFTNVGLGIVHSMAHPLSAFYDVPHGVANALILPYVLKFNSVTCEDKMVTLAKTFDPEFDERYGSEAATERCIELINTFNSIAGLPHKLKEINVKVEDIDALAREALNDAATPDNRREVNIEEFKSYTKLCMNRIGGYMEYKKTYINGCWVDGNSDKELKAVNPSNGEVIAVVKENNLDDVKSAVASAKMLFMLQERGEI